MHFSDAIRVLFVLFRPKSTHPITSRGPWTLSWFGLSWSGERSLKSLQTNTMLKSPRNWVVAGNFCPKKLGNLLSKRLKDFVFSIRRSIPITNTNPVKSLKVHRQDRLTLEAKAAALRKISGPWMRNRGLCVKVRRQLLLSRHIVTAAWGSKLNRI